MTVQRWIAVAFVVCAAAWSAVRLWSERGILNRAILAELLEVGVVTVAVYAVFRIVMDRLTRD